MSQRLVTDEPLRVQPDLIGRPLAAPWRRFVAFAVDYLVLLVPSLLLAVAASAAAIWVRDPKALHSLLSLIGLERSTPEVKVQAMRDLTTFLEAHHAVGLPPELRKAMAAGQNEVVTEILSRANISITLGPPGHREEDGGEAPGAEAQATPQIRVWLEQLIPPVLRAIVFYGLGALYFAALTTWTGATVGKRLLGIRVVRLDGHHLSFTESLERFIGYLHIPGSLFLNLLDLWRDPNRRLPHDRVVHTAVIRVEKPRPVPEAGLDMQAGEGGGEAASGCGEASADRGGASAEQLGEV
jgi:uncharacterized RDD family membrane protein YckC